MQTVRSSKRSHLFSAVLLLCIVRESLQLICGSNNTSAEFENNLNTVVRNLIKNTAPSNGFNTSVYGKSPDRVYGLLQCTGGTTAEECLSCSRDLNTTIREKCGNTRGARYLVTKCFIRYEDYPFFGILDTNPSIFYNSYNVTDEPAVFRKAVREMFTNLSNEALQSPLRYSSGSTITSKSYPIYIMVQCWRDLTSAQDCKTCLTTATNELLAVTFQGNEPSRGGGTECGSCFVRYETYTFFNPAPPPPPSQQPPSSSPTPTPAKKSPNKIGIVLGIVGGLFFLLLLSLFAFRKRFNHAVLWMLGVLRKEDRPGARDNLDREVNSVIGKVNGMVFNLENINAATRNFHEENKLGQGGFGDVYKGTMPNGTQIAVKRLSVQSMQGKKQFLNEVKLVAGIQHRNLVKLLGCCAEGSERLLVYEFLPNRSLDKILFHPERRKELDWSKRLNIILGIARGLLYLHHDSQLRIIHRDIKAGNILLDEEMQPKISDFGLARLFHLDETHVNTGTVGTLGYMAPEYALRGQLSTKADIYSFGVVILEIICGRKNNDNRLSSEFQNLLEWVWRSYKEGDIMDVIDKLIIETSHEEASKYIQVGLLCTQANPSLRPPMSNVHAMLSNAAVRDLPDPTEPAYVINIQKNVPLFTSASASASASTSKNTSSSLSTTNSVTITDLGAR